jgi:hypothetical protein
MAEPKNRILYATILSKTVKVFSDPGRANPRYEFEQEGVPLFGIEQHLVGDGPNDCQLIALYWVFRDGVKAGAEEGAQLGRRALQREFLDLMGMGSTDD